MIELVGGKDAVKEIIVSEEIIHLPDAQSDPEGYKRASERIMQRMEDKLKISLAVDVRMRGEQDQEFLAKKRNREMENRQKL